MRVERLDPSDSYSQRVNNEIFRARTIAANVKKYETDQLLVAAENDVKKWLRLSRL